MSDHATKCADLQARRDNLKRQRKTYSHIQHKLVLTRCRQIRAELRAEKRK